MKSVLLMTRWILMIGSNQSGNTRPGQMVTVVECRTCTVECATAGNHLKLLFFRVATKEEDT